MSFDFEKRDDKPRKPSVMDEWCLDDLMPFINTLKESEKIQLMGRIDAILPMKSLKDMDLEHELVMQFQVAKALQSDTLASEEEESHRKATTISTCASVLQQLVKMQTELHTAERFKAMESNLIKVLQDFPDLSNKFLDEYERSLRSLS